MGTQRTIITISDDDRVWLEGYSKARGISMAEAIRRGITRLRAEEGYATYERILEQTRGIWSKGDGLEYQDRMRREWNEHPC